MVWLNNRIPQKNGCWNSYYACLNKSNRAFALGPWGTRQQRRWRPYWCTWQKHLIKIMLSWHTNMAAVTSYGYQLHACWSKSTKFLRLIEIWVRFYIQLSLNICHSKMVAISTRNTKKHRKFANFVRLYFPYFANKFWNFTTFKRFFLGISFY